MASIRFRFFALGLHLIAKQLQTVVAGIVYLARLAFGAEAAVSSGELVEDAVEASVALAREPTVLVDGRLEVQNPQLKNVYEVFRFDLLEARILL